MQYPAEQRIESSVTQRKETQTSTTEQNKMQRKAAHLTKRNAKRLQAVHHNAV